MLKKRKSHSWSHGVRVLLLYSRSYAMLREELAPGAGSPRVYITCLIICLYMITASWLTFWIHAIQRVSISVAERSGCKHEHRDTNGWG